MKQFNGNTTLSEFLLETAKQGADAAGIVGASTPVRVLIVLSNHEFVLELRIVGIDGLMLDDRRPTDDLH